MKLKDKLSDILIVGTVMLFFLIISSSTFAKDGKNYPGMMGVPFNDPINNTLPNGMLENRSTEDDMSVQLPIIHDKMKSHLRRVIVRCVDVNPSTNVIAQVNSRAQYGTSLTIWATPFKGSNGALSYYTHGLTFNDLDLGKDLRQYYYVTVFIPRAVEVVGGDASLGWSKIVSYYAEER